MNERMVRVRVAVVVDGEGKWEAVGSDGQADRDSQQVAQDNLDSPLPQLVHFVECNVLIPRGHVLNGTCVLSKEVDRVASAGR